LELVGEAVAVNLPRVQAQVAVALAVAGPERKPSSWQAILETLKPTLLVPLELQVTLVREVVVVLVVLVVTLPLEAPQFLYTPHTAVVVVVAVP
jgi:hypothetical protein